MGTKRFTGKVAIVTGAAKGIGAAIAEYLAAEGAKVVVNYASSKEEALHVVSTIEKQGGKAVAIQANMSHPKEIQHLFAESKRAFGHLDILINNAGIYEFVELEKITPDHFHKHFDLNVLGLLLACQEAVKHFRSGGTIVNISSIVSHYPSPKASVYSATKAAVDAITKSLSIELGPRKIRVNAVNPGMIQTEGLHDSGIDQSEFRKKVEAETPLGRIGRPEDVAKAVLFLASDDAEWVSGATLLITGGER